MVREGVVRDLVRRFKSAKEMLEATRGLSVTKEELAEAVAVFYLKEYYQMEFSEVSAYTSMHVTIVYQKYEENEWKKQFQVRKIGYVDNRE